MSTMKGHHASTHGPIPSLDEWAQPLIAACIHLPHITKLTLRMEARLPRTQFTGMMTQLIPPRTLARPQRGETRLRLVSPRHRALLKGQRRRSFVVVLAFHMNLNPYEKWVHCPSIATILSSIPFELASRRKTSSPTLCCIFSWESKHSAHSFLTNLGDLRPVVNWYGHLADFTPWDESKSQSTSDARSLHRNYDLRQDLHKFPMFLSRPWTLEPRGGVKDVATRALPFRFSSTRPTNRRPYIVKGFQRAVAGYRDS